MAEDVRMALDELPRKAHGDGDVGFLFSTEGVRVMARALIELEVTHHPGADRYERTAARTGRRNGDRGRPWGTRVGTIGLGVPRVRDGSFFPALPEPRRRAERALVAVIQEESIRGVSTRRVDALVKALGMAGISTSRVARARQGPDREVERSRARARPGCFPSRWRDATFVKVRPHGRVVSMAVVVATGVTSRGEREVLGLEVGPSEDGACWQQFLRGPVGRGLAGVRPVISDAHGGLVQAIGTVLQGASWQRGRVHWLRNALAPAPKSAAEMPAATIRTVFVRPGAAGAQERWRRVAAGLRGQSPKLADPMDRSEADVPADTAFPREHWRQIWSNTPLERLMQGIKRRTNVVGTFPNDAAITRLVGAVLLAQHEEWQVGRRPFSVESLMKLQREGDQAALAPAAAD